MSGIDNVFADYLSRIKPESKGSAYSENKEDTEEIRNVEIASAEEVIDAEIAAEEVKFQLVSLDSLQDLQSVDPEVDKIKKGDKSQFFTWHPLNNSRRPRRPPGRTGRCDQS